MVDLGVDEPVILVEVEVNEDTGRGQQALVIGIMELISYMMADRSTVCCRVAARRAPTEGGAARICVLVL